MHVWDVVVKYLTHVAGVVSSCKILPEDVIFANLFEESLKERGNLITEICVDISWSVFVMKSKSESKKDKRSEILKKQIIVK